MEIENLQLYPTKKRTALNDKATKILFNLTPETFNKMIQRQSKLGLIEKRKHKKQDKIKSSFKLSTAEGFTLMLPLTEYDRAVFDVCISEYVQGNKYLTVPMIQRSLSGKNCDGNKNGSLVFSNQRTAILTAIDKLRITQYDADLLNAFEKLNYEGAEKVQKASILATETIKKVVGGEEVDIIHILTDSPLLKIAKAKEQILTYDADLLDVPSQNNTPLVITLKNYILRRVLEIKQHSKQLKPILTLDDIFQKARITDSSRKAKLDARATLDKFFAHLQTKGVIKTYEWTKKGNKFYSINFTY